MGCSSSSSPMHDNISSEIEDYIRMSQNNMSNINNKSDETILQAFQRLDEEIYSLEHECPGPRLATAEAWIDHLISLNTEFNTTDEYLKSLAILPERENNLQIPSMSNLSEIDELDTETIITDYSQQRNKDDDDIIKVRNLAVQLGVVFDVDKALLHEEFLARVSRSMMMVQAKILREEMIEHSKQRRALLLDSYNKLRNLYAEQDALISAVSSGTYLSKQEEKLDSELETTRQIRDKLGSVAEQWRTSGALLHTAAKAAIRAVEFWNLAEVSKDANERISLALDCRNFILNSLAAYEGAQSALPQVEIPFVTPRQISAVRHANVYLLTDMANHERFKHTKNVFQSYQNNTNKAVEWLHTTYKNTLRKDLDEAEDNVTKVAKKLRMERSKNMSDIVGNRMYIPVKNEFR